MSSQHYIRVATVREKSGSNENFSRSGKSQRKSLILSKSVKSQGILFSGLDKFFFKILKCIFFGKDEKYAAKRSI